MDQRRRSGDFIIVRIVETDLGKYLGPPGTNGLIVASYRDGRGENVTETFNATAGGSTSFTLDIFAPS